MDGDGIDDLQDMFPSNASEWLDTDLDGIGNNADDDDDNDGIPDLDDDEYVTLLLCRLDPHTRALTYASAGHAPSFLLDKTGVVNLTLGATGVPLGLFSHASFSSEVLPFSDPGQVLLLPTDGIIESKSPDSKPFGDKRTIDCVASHRHESAHRIVEDLHKAVKAHAKNLSQLDDITAVVVKVI